MQLVRTIFGLLILSISIGCNSIDKRHDTRAMDSARSINLAAAAQSKSRDSRKPSWIIEFETIVRSVPPGHESELIEPLNSYIATHEKVDAKGLGYMALLEAYRGAGDYEGVFRCYEVLLQMGDDRHEVFSTNVMYVMQHLEKCEQRGLTESVDRCVRFVLHEGPGQALSQALPLETPQGREQQWAACLAYGAMSSGATDIALTKRCLARLMEVPNRSARMNFMAAFAFGSIRDKENANRLLDLLLSQNPPQDVRQKAEAYREIVRSFRPLPHRLH